MSIFDPGTWARLNGVLHKSLRSVCVCIPLIVARQRLGKNVTAATNTHATTELLDASSSMRPASYQWKVGDNFFPEYLVYLYIATYGFDLIHTPISVYWTNTCGKYSFIIGPILMLLDGSYLPRFLTQFLSVLKPSKVRQCSIIRNG
jgi:hypothetical protein